MLQKCNKKYGEATPTLVSTSGCKAPTPSQSLSGTTALAQAKEGSVSYRNLPSAAAACRYVRKRENRSTHPSPSKFCWPLSSLWRLLQPAVLFPLKNFQCLSSLPSNPCELSGSTLPSAGTQVSFCVKSCLILLFSALFPLLSSFH